MDSNLKAVDPDSKVVSVAYKYKGEIQGRALEINMKSKSPNMMSFSMSMMGMVMSKQVFNGTTGYMEQQGQKHPFNEEQLVQYKSLSYPFNEVNFKKTGTLSLLEIIDGKKVYIINIGKSKTIYYDAETFYKIKEVEKQKGPGGQEMITELSYLDYKEVDGVMIPHTYKMTVGPQEIKFELVSAVINGDMPDKDFE